MEDEIDDIETDLDLQTNRIDNVEDDVSEKHKYYNRYF